MWYQEKEGKLYCQERIKDEMTGKTKIISVVVPKNTPAERRKAAEKLEKKAAAKIPEKLKLSDVIELHNKEHVRMVRESTYNRDSTSLRTMLGILDDVYFEKLTAGYIRMRMIASGKDNITLNELLKRFKTFLYWCYRNDYLPDRSIPDKLELFRAPSKRSRIETKFLEKDELQKLVDSMDIERWSLLTQFLALSGLRIGEAIALDDADVDDQYIHVSKTYNEGLAYLGPAKTESSMRDVYIQPELAVVIRKIRICMKKQCLMYGYKKTDYFFTGINGRRIGYAAYNKYLKECASKVVPEKLVTPHTLRHTMTSLFAEAGIPLDTISHRLGHENSSITRQVYMHITEERKNRENAQVKSVSLFG